MGEAEATRERASRLRWAAGFALGAAAGLALGLAVGPTGAAMLGFRFPYLKLALGDPSAGAAARAPRPVPVKAPAPSAAPPPIQARGPLAAQPAPLVIPAGRSLSIGVFGDSMADGLWAALYRDFRKSGSVEVLRLAQNSTGLTRYDYVNVQTQTRDQLAEHHVDIAVILFGTNDGQGIVADDGKVYAFGTPAWRQAYEARIDALIGLLRSQGAVVYWVGLPKMEKAEMDRRASMLNEIFQTRMAALGAPFISTVAQTVDEQGQYDAYLAVPGEAHRRLMRAPDGVHMTMAGYSRLALPVAARIHDDLAARIQAGAPQAASNPAAPNPAAPNQAAQNRPLPNQSFADQAAQNRPLPNRSFADQAAQNRPLPNRSFADQAAQNQSLPNRSFPNPVDPNRAAQNQPGAIPFDPVPLTLSRPTFTPLGPVETAERP